MCSNRQISQSLPSPNYIEYHCKLMAAHTILSDQHLNKRPHQSRWQMGTVKSRERVSNFLPRRESFFYPPTPAKLISTMKYQFLQLSRAPLLGVKFTNGPISCVCLPRPGHRRWVIAQASGWKFLSNLLPPCWFISASWLARQKGIKTSTPLLMEIISRRGAERKKPAQMSSLSERACKKRTVVEENIGLRHSVARFFYY